MLQNTLIHLVAIAALILFARYLYTKNTIDEMPWLFYPINILSVALLLYFFCPTKENNSAHLVGSIAIIQTSTLMMGLFCAGLYKTLDSALVGSYVGFLSGFCFGVPLIALSFSETAFLISIILIVLCLLSIPLTNKISHFIRVLTTK